MESKHTPYWKPARKITTLKQACLQALQQGACYIHFAGHTQQPCVIIPLAGNLTTGDNFVLKL